jgi:hypothetical protein
MTFALWTAAALTTILGAALLLLPSAALQRAQPLRVTV